MKKLFSIFSIILFVSVLAPACSSADESFEDIVMDSQLDQTAPRNGSNGNGIGGGPGGG